MESFKPAAWDLNKITPVSIEAAQTEIERKSRIIEQQKVHLTNSITSQQFISIIQDLEILRQDCERLGVFAHLRFCENSNHQKAIAEMSQIETFLVAINNRLLFLTLWFKHLPELKALSLIKESGRYWYYLETLRKNKKYTLLENEEKIISIKDSNGTSALNNIYNLLTTNFSYSFQGKKRTQEEMTNFVRSKYPAVREKAYRVLFEPYEKHKLIIGEIYKNIVNDWREENVNLRKYKNPLSVRNEVNDIPDKAIEILLKVCEKNQSIFQQFFEIKRKKLGLKTLRRFDLYAPLQEERESISYGQAVKLVLQTFGEFSPKFKQAAEAIISNKHIHSTIQEGKRSGAFCCPATTKIPPYILLTYTNKYRDVFTLAHELGHGVHMILSQEQTEFTMDACLPLAETASIFSEMLLSEKLLKDNSRAAKSIIFDKIADLYASIIRQAGFVNFEIKAHQLIKDGKTVDEISQVYLQDLQQQLGSKVQVDQIFSKEWLYIPHMFHTPFYCYAYAFGNLLTLALYGMYKEKGTAFSDKIIAMLAKGGSDSPLAITKAVGVNICSEKFWQKGFDAIAKMIESI